jgi:CheY-like chemotaxis protein
LNIQSFELPAESGVPRKGDLRALRASFRRPPVLCACNPHESRLVLDSEPTANTPTQIRLLLVEDHVGYAQTLATLLGADPRICVVGHARDGIEGIELAELRRPDVVLMDIHMPRLDGIEATRVLSVRLQHTAVLMLSSYTDPEAREDAFAAGAVGYYLKDCLLDELADAVVSAPAAIGLGQAS